MRTIFLSALLALAGCAARQTPPNSPTEVVSMDGVRIVAKHDDKGGYTFESYDAEDLFKRGNEQLDAGRCPEAVQLYDRVADEFPDGRYASASLYNAGLCLAQTGHNEEALAHFSRLLTSMPDSPDVKHASFQVGHLLATLARWDEALARAGELLARTDLDAPER